MKNWFMLMTGTFQQRDDVIIVKESSLEFITKVKAQIQSFCHWIENTQ